MTTTDTEARSLAQAVIEGTWQGPIRVDRIGRAGGDKEVVFIRTDSAQRIALILDPVEAAGLGEALMKVSGMATSTEGAPSLAEAVKAGLKAKSVTRARVVAETGITHYRLRQILNRHRPMTHAEHVAISEVGGRRNSASAWSLSMTRGRISRSARAFSLSGTPVA